MTGVQTCALPILSLTALSISAVLSIKAGLLPTPPYINGFPDLYDISSNLFIPVFIISDTLPWHMSSRVPTFDMVRSGWHVLRHFCVRNAGSFKLKAKLSTGEVELRQNIFAFVLHSERAIIKDGTVVSLEFGDRKRVV